MQYVLGLSDMITTYNFDRKKSSWCEIVFQLQLRNKSKLDLATIVERFEFFEIFSPYSFILNIDILTYLVATVSKDFLNSRNDI